MEMIYPNSPEKCIPICIGKGESKTGPRIGGASPEGIFPLYVLPDTEYFCTVPLCEKPYMEISVFLSLTLPVMLEHRDCLLDGREVQVVSHAASRRGTSDYLRSRLSAHPLILDPVADDWLIDDRGDRIIRSNHKLGGRTHLIRPYEDLVAKIRDMNASGYLHVLQVDFPGGGDAPVQGNWPFADGIFHLFGKPPFEASSPWQFLWQT